MANVGDYAIVVGIDDYPGYRPLQGAVRDAKDFVGWLCKEPYGGDVPTANCKTIYSVTNPLSPLQQQIDEAFDAIFSSVPKGEPARRLYVYFSGHGMAESNLISDLCLANWAQKFPNRALDAQQYLDTVMKLGKFAEIVMFMDCCRVRLVSAHGHTPDFIAASPGKGAPRARYFTASATEFLNLSYEAAVSKSSSDEAQVRGYFTTALMAALRGAAAISGGGVPASRLKMYLEENVPLLANAAGYIQDPEVINGLKGDPLFGSAPPSGPEPASPPSGAPGPSASPKGGGPPPSFRVPLTLYDSLGARSLTLLDQSNQTVFHGPVRKIKRLRVRPGSYKLRTLFTNATVETPLYLDRETEISTHEQLRTAPEVYSAAPLANSPTSHEYYSVPSQKWSRTPTRVPLPGPSTSSLFIFIRAIDEEMHDRDSDLGKGLLLLDAQGEQISDFSPSVTRHDSRFGWLSFHAAAPKGALLLRFTGEPARDLCLHLYPRLQTQVFFMYRGKPLLDTMKIFLSPIGRGFQPLDSETAAADIALNGLQSSQDLLSESALNQLLYGKFESPMLGLVGAHVLLKRQRALQKELSLERGKPILKERETQQDQKHKINVVLRNLNRLLPQSPDVAALNLLAGSNSPVPLRKIKFDEAPMLRPGLVAVIAEAAKRPAILGKTSPIPQIAPRLYADTPWSTWQPIPSETGLDSGGNELNWVHLAILDFVKKAMQPAKKKEGTKRPKRSQIAKKLGVPQQTVVQAAKDLNTTSVNILLTKLPEEYQELFAPSRTKSQKKISQGTKKILSALVGRPSKALAKSRTKKRAESSKAAKSRTMDKARSEISRRIDYVNARVDYQKTRARFGAPRTQRRDAARSES